MKDFRLFLEHRTVDTIKIIDKTTHEEINPIDVVIDSDTLDDLIAKINGSHTENFYDKYKVCVAKKKSNNWLVNTTNEWKLQPMKQYLNDNYLVCTNNEKLKSYTYKDLIAKLSANDDTAVILVTLPK